MGLLRKMGLLSAHMASYARVCAAPTSRHWAGPHISASRSKGCLRQLEGPTGGARGRGAQRQVGQVGRGRRRIADDEVLRCAAVALPAADTSDEVAAAMAHARRASCTSCEALMTSR